MSTILFMDGFIALNSNNIFVFKRVMIEYKHRVKYTKENIKKSKDRSKVKLY